MKKIVLLTIFTVIIFTELGYIFYQNNKITKLEQNITEVEYNIESQRELIITLTPQHEDDDIMYK